jgi:molybdopterin molybdotransferase
LDEAREIVLAEARPLGAEPVRVSDALDRVLARAVIATKPVPSFDNSAMDGFAVRAADTAGAQAERPIELSVVDESRAGRPSSVEVTRGSAVAISTGARLPIGADAVVPLESAAARDGVVEILAETSRGTFVRGRGEDVGVGEQVLAEATSIGPAELGVLAALGIPEAICSTRPRTALLISGDELVAPGARLGPGQIHDSNSVTLGALTRVAGADLVGTRHVRDDLDEVGRALETALAADLVVISGGVSVGEHDHVREALTELGVEQLFWGVALRPGRPTWFGRAPSGALVFGLPGNPVSAMVCFVLLVRPALAAMQGADPDQPRSVAVLERDYPKPPGRAHAIRCTLALRDDGWHATPTRPEQASHILTSMLGADALALIPAETRDVPAGSRVEIEMLA